MDFIVCSDFNKNIQVKVCKSTIGEYQRFCHIVQPYFVCVCVFLDKSATALFPHQLYSHSVVPGGLEVRSNITLEMPGIFLISFTIFSTTSSGI